MKNGREEWKKRIRLEAGRRGGEEERKRGREKTRKRKRRREVHNNMETEKQGKK